MSDIFPGRQSVICTSLVFEASSRTSVTGSIDDAEGRRSNRFTTIFLFDRSVEAVSTNSTMNLLPSLCQCSRTGCVHKSSFDH